VIAFGFLAVAYLWFIHYEDRYTTVPRKLAAAGFVWGAVAAVGAFALLGNDALMNLYAKTFGASLASDWGAALAAPIDEEVAKGAGILLLLTLGPRLIRTPFDGLIVGALVGLGFQISEDISYAFIGAANAFGDVGAAWATIIARTLASIPSHWMFSGVFGAGLVWFIGRPEVPARKGLGAGLMLTAMLMHGLWNASPRSAAKPCSRGSCQRPSPPSSSACSPGSTPPPCLSSASGSANSWPPKSSSASSRRPSSTR
jgi:RsiW-degrading membrane proteinase PrsW (M82 family)